MKSVIIGAGTYGEVYFAYLIESGVEIVGFIDDDQSLWGETVQNVPVLGGAESLKTICKTLGVEAVYCPIGRNETRVRLLTLARECGYKTPNYIHPTVVMSSQVSIANEGVYILAGTVMMPYVTIEKDVMISVGVNIPHHAYLSQGTFISTGVSFGASVRAEPYAYVGIGAIIMTGVKILGRGCLVGAGAVVIRDVEDNAVVAGVPAKFIKYKS